MEEGGLVWTDVKPEGYSAGTWTHVRSVNMALCDIDLAAGIRRGTRSLEVTCHMAQGAPIQEALPNKNTYATFHFLCFGLFTFSMER